MTNLEDNKLLHDNQHGFRSDLSTSTQLAEITHDFPNSLNFKGQIDAVFLDFSKAFDVVPHDDLITKLSAIGVDQNIVRWVACYLSSRKQYVIVNDGVPDSLDVQCRPLLVRTRRRVAALLGAPALAVRPRIEANRHRRTRAWRRGFVSIEKRGSSPFVFSLEPNLKRLRKHEALQESALRSAQRVV